MKKKNKLAIKKSKQAAELKKQAVALARARTAQKSAKLTGAKRKVTSFLARYLCVSPKHHQAIRNVDSFKAKNYNLATQVCELINHVFVAYPTPKFLYRELLSEAGLALVFGESLETQSSSGQRSINERVRLFCTVSQGRSVAKFFESDRRVTKSVAHWFLFGPDENTIDENIFWAQCRALGISTSTCQFLVKRLSPIVDLYQNDRMADVLNFFARYESEMGKYTKDELVDFIVAVAANHEFSFKGRTLGSMVKLCDEWHRTMYAGTVGRYQSWPAQFDFWSLERKGVDVQAFELSNNRALADEGRRQRHCVFSYTRWCISGQTRIVSFRWMAEGACIERVTVEVDTRLKQVVQAKGRLNRRPSEDEISVIRRWARDNGLCVSIWD